MISISVLLDTDFLVAYYNTREKNHPKAVELLNELETGELGRLWVSDYGFDETITLLKKYLGNKAATEKGNVILSSLELVRVDTEAFGLAWELSKKLDKLSFTDCTHIALMKHFDIDYLATFDSAFDEIVKILR